MRFPPRDVECRSVVPNQVGDLERAYKYIKNWDVCVQAGGNVGIWPIDLSLRFWKVYTFEPDAENYECLKQNISFIKNIRHERASLGEKPGSGSLEGDPSNCGAYQTVEGEDFPILTIDGLELDRCDFICLDIEGMELSALRGAEMTLRTFKPVVMLEDKGLSERYGVKKGEAGAYLEELGYELVDEVHRDLIYCAA